MDVTWMCKVNSHCHVAVRTAVSKGAPLFLEGDEVPNSHHSVFRHVEMEELHAGKGAVGVKLARRPGEIVSYEQAIYGMKQEEGYLDEIQLLYLLYEYWQGKKVEIGLEESVLIQFG